MLLQFVGEFSHRGILAKDLSLEIVAGLLNAHTLTDALDQLQRLGSLLLGQEIDLQRQLLTVFGRLTFAIPE